MATSSTNACIFWYPSGSPLRIVDLGGPLSIMDARPVRDEITRESINGLRSQLIFNARWLVQIRAELLVSEDVIAELEAVVNHLQRGGTIALAEQGNKTLGSFLRTTPKRGATQIVFAKQLYSQFGGSWSPSAGERLLMRGASPRGLFEPLECTGTGSTAGAVLSPAIRHEWEGEGWIFVHNRGFWPGLVLRRGATNADLLPGPDRVSWTLDLPLEEPPGFLDRAATHPEQPLLGETASQGGLSLDDVMRVPGDKQILGSSSTGRIGGGSIGPKFGRWF